MGAKRDNKKGEGTTVVIRREEVVEGGHHGGAWKVAYADFVTAMMAFFLLMWLLNATSEQQRRGIADYFSPINPLARSQSGSGKPFGGQTPYEDGAMVSDRGAVEVNQRPPTSTRTEDDPDATSPQPTANLGERDANGLRDDAASGSATAGQAQAGTAASGQAQAGQAAAGNQHTGAAAAGSTQPGTAQAGTTQPGSAPAGTTQPGSAAQAAPAMPMTAAQEEAAFHSAADQIRDAIRNDPTLAGLAPQLSVDETPEGLRIQLLDADKQAMFAFGSSAPNDRARQLLQKVAPILSRLPEEISITGHTDAAPYRGTDRTNWELSAERANATRRALLDGGLADLRFRSVSGDADRDLLLPGDPLAAANRRIAIVVLRHVKPGADKPAADKPAVAPARPPAGSDQTKPL